MARPGTHHGFEETAPRKRRLHRLQRPRVALAASQPVQPAAQAGGDAQRSAADSLAVAERHVGALVQDDLLNKVRHIKKHYCRTCCVTS